VKLCLSIEIQEGMSYADTLAMTRAGEALGWDSSLLAEHYTPSGPADHYAGGIGAHMSADAWVYLGALARDTQNIRLGTLVSPVTFRHPSVLAKMAATLDHISNGRAELGIGAGWLEGEHQTYGFDFPAPAQRVDLVEEQLQVITGLWSQSAFTHHGRAYQLEAAEFTPKPIQQPGPTIIVGGRTTSQRLAKLAARYSDEFVIGQPTAEDCRAVRARLDAACKGYGRDPASVKLSAFVPFCVAETEAEVERLMDDYRAANPQYVGMMRNKNTSTWLKGTPDQVRSQLDTLEANGIDRVMVSVNCDLHRDMLALLPSGALAKA
jgi:alkanesulfonate monooxygenase SsuD/methylene tetrahydromethanopterin reductase-like flavin-dependent oxidoreductase (luciferase family)